MTFGLPHSACYEFVHSWHNDCRGTPTEHPPVYSAVRSETLRTLLCLPTGDRRGSARYSPSARMSRWPIWCSIPVTFVLVVSRLRSRARRERERAAVRHMPGLAGARSILDFPPPLDVGAPMDSRASLRSTGSPCSFKGDCRVDRFCRQTWQQEQIRSMLRRRASRYIERTVGRFAW